jgi:hypothetical protein
MMLATLVIGCSSGKDIAGSPGDAGGPGGEPATDRVFEAPEVLSVFPARLVDGDGASVPTLERVCGRDDAGTTADHLEVVFGLRAGSHGSGESLACGAADHDRSVMDGDNLFDGAVRASGQAPTFGASGINIDLACIESERQGGCTKPAVLGESKLAAAIEYRRMTSPASPEASGRCRPDDEGTRLNVAVLYDLSGSLMGATDADGRELPALSPILVAPDPSDPNAARANVLHDLVSAELNPGYDRVVGISFGVDRVGVAATDALKCASSGASCSTNADCDEGDYCAFDLLATNGFDALGLDAGLDKAFGNGAEHVSWLSHALDTLAFDANGRAPTYAAIDAAFQFLDSRAEAGAKAIVLLTDGPDTCMPSEAARYVAADGACYEPCPDGGGDAGLFDALRSAVAARAQQQSPPIAIHVIQWSAKGYPQPDGRLYDLACISGGTFQFLDGGSKDVNATAFENRLRRALGRTRRALAGSWRVAVTLPQLADQTVPRGIWMWTAGALRLAADAWPGLVSQAAVWQDTATFDATSQPDDERLVFRVPCGPNAHCGGQNCGKNACLDSGLCSSGPAVDHTPCPDGVCCEGVCDASCAGGCEL